jgi:hypothetical protein
MDAKDKKVLRRVIEVLNQARQEAVYCKSSGCDEGMPELEHADMHIDDAIGYIEELLS